VSALVLSPPLPGIGDRILGPQAVREFWFHAAVTAAGMRSLKHLLALADELCERGVGLVVLKQHIDTTTPAGRLVFHILGAIDEFQRELIVEGTREGLDAARARGRAGGRRPKLSDAKAATVRRMYQATGPDGKRLHTVAEIAQTVGIHRTTVYDYLKKEG
jgi:DNA invertase Pin-like site-specific DNA recombinase